MKTITIMMPATPIHLDNSAIMSRLGAPAFMYQVGDFDREAIVKEELLPWLNICNASKKTPETLTSTTEGDTRTILVKVVRLNRQHTFVLDRLVGRGVITSYEA